jgi:hypothetical protein
VGLRRAVWVQVCVACLSRHPGVGLHSLSMPPGCGSA